MVIQLSALLTLIVSLTPPVGGGSTTSSPPLPAQSAQPSLSPSLPAALAQLDDLHRRRDEPAIWVEEQRAVQALLARAPNDFRVLWRSARFYFWASDDPGTPRDQRSRWGKDGWELAERAISVNPNDAAGYYWAALCMGNYVLGLGAMKALSQGIEGKFRDRLGRAQALNAGYERGGIEIAWGRFYDKLPWPKRDRKKAQEHLRRALEIDPAGLRARVYLAISLMDSGSPQEAKRLLDEVGAAPLGRYDVAEERRAKALASALLPELYAKLK
jgi:tetratricopeptide (TPR) repeat protein